MRRRTWTWEIVHDHPGGPIEWHESFRAGGGGRGACQRGRRAEDLNSPPLASRTGGGTTDSGCWRPRTAREQTGTWVLHLRGLNSVTDPRASCRHLDLSPARPALDFGISGAVRCGTLASSEATAFAAAVRRARPLSPKAISPFATPREEGTAPGGRRRGEGPPRPLPFFLCSWHRRGAAHGGAQTSSAADPREPVGAGDADRPSRGKPKQ